MTTEQLGLILQGVPSFEDFLQLWNGLRPQSLDASSNVRAPFWSVTQCWCPISRWLGLPKCVPFVHAGLQSIEAPPIHFTGATLRFSLSLDAAHATRYLDEPCSVKRASYWDLFVYDRISDDKTQRETWRTPRWCNFDAYWLAPPGRSVVCVWTKAETKYRWRVLLKRVYYGMRSVFYAKLWTFTFLWETSADMVVVLGKPWYFIYRFQNWRILVKKIQNDRGKKVRRHSRNWCIAS